MEQRVSGSTFDFVEDIVESEVKEGKETRSGNERHLPIVPYFPSSLEPFGREGILRIANRSKEAGEVTITAYDDSGQVYGPIQLALEESRSGSLLRT